MNGSLKPTKKTGRNMKSSLKPGKMRGDMIGPFKLYEGFLNYGQSLFLDPG